MCRRLQACQQALPGKAGRRAAGPHGRTPSDRLCRAQRRRPGIPIEGGPSLGADLGARRPSSAVVSQRRGHAAAVVAQEGPGHLWCAAKTACGEGVVRSRGLAAAALLGCCSAFYVDLRSACGFCAGARYNLGQMASKSVTKKLLCMQCEEELPRSHYKTTQWELRANRTCRKFQGAPTAQPVDVNLVLSRCRSRRVNLVLSDVPCAHGAGRQWGWGCSDDPSRCDIYNIYI